MYTFFILNLQQADQGHYMCKVQEIGKHRNKWTAWSNGSASTEIQGGVIDEGDKETATHCRGTNPVLKAPQFEDYCNVGVISLQISDESSVEKNHKAWKFFEG
ncbi:hypothetical protein JD844_031802 [Phrynosoma platyrhinos]|uniref:Uncharacterized protein n=1 Tax=Phrynosoma platyrhinos TaxID=52577 RepID=A0ABQ7T4H5_PHRPL|nr:hypothetical protein JD844_031802 [Phrynosoma platyrhinos]